MGHKSGLTKVGARGKMKPRSASSLEAAFDGGDTVDIKAMAAKHVPMSMETLARAARHKLTKRQEKAGQELAPWPIRTKAARDILELAGGRPETREPVRQEAGLTVVINKISTGESFEKTMQRIEDVADAIDAEVVDRAPED